TATASMIPSLRPRRSSSYAQTFSYPQPIGEVRSNGKTTSYALRCTTSTGPISTNLVRRATAPRCCSTIGWSIYAVDVMADCDSVRGAIRLLGEVDADREHLPPRRPGLAAASGDQHAGAALLDQRRLDLWQLRRLLGGRALGAVDVGPEPVKDARLVVPHAR